MPYPCASGAPLGLRSTTRCISACAKADRKVAVSHPFEGWSRGHGSGVREFLRVLALHEGHVAADIEQAVKEALACGSAHFEGIKLCLHRLQHPDHTLSSVFLLPAAQQPRLPSLEWTGVQAADLQRYDRFLTVEADAARIQVMA